LALRTLAMPRPVDAVDTAVGRRGWHRAPGARVRSPSTSSCSISMPSTARRGASTPTSTWRRNGGIHAWRTPVNRRPGRCRWPRSRASRFVSSGGSMPTQVR